MANAKQVLDVHVSKGITVAQSNEHMRNWTEKGWKRATDLGNYDPTREHLNFEVVSGGKIRPIDKGRSIPERMAELLHKRGIKDPNEGLEEPRFPYSRKYHFWGLSHTDAGTRIWQAGSRF